MIDSPFNKDIAFSVATNGCGNYKLHPEEVRILSPKAVEKRRMHFYLSIQYLIINRPGSGLLTR